MTQKSKIQRACFFICNKGKKCETYIRIYKNLDTLQMSRQFALRFIYKKTDTFCHAILYDFFVIIIYICTNFMTLGVT